MEELGKILRQSRIEKGFSLEDISKETMIQIRLLKTLEEGDLSKFPAEVYAKGAICNYARVVGIDPKNILEMYNNKKSDISYEEKEKDGQDKIYKEIKPKKDILKLFTLTINAKYLISIVILFLIIIAIVYSHIGEPQHNNSDGGDHVSLPHEIEDALITENNLDRKNINFNKSELILEEETSKEAIYSIIGSEQIEAQILFTEDCWVAYYCDTHPQEEKIFHSGDELVLTAEEKTWFRFGFPPAVQIKINNIELPRLFERREPFNLLIVLESEPNQ